jgi:hypothetical protein
MHGVAGRRALRRTWVDRLRLGVSVAFVALAGLPSVGRAEVNVGARFGWSDVADEVFTGSGELGGTNLIGAHLGLNLIRLLELEVAGEYINEDFTFEEGVIGGVEAAGDGKWEDMAVYGTGHVRLLSLASLRAYVGGGLNIHWAELTLENVTESAVDAGSDELEEAVQEIAGERSELGWHAVGGLRLAPGGTALSAFVEGRYMKGFDEEQLPKSTSIYLGASIRL